MRSPTLFLAACFMGVLVNSVSAAAVIDYCEYNATTQSCLKFVGVSAASLKWREEAAFKEAKEVTNAPLHEVNMHMGLFIRKGSGTAEKVAFTSSDWKKCKRGLLAHHASNELHSSDQPEITVTTNMLFAVFDPECRVNVKLAANLTLRVYQLFQRHVVTASIGGPVEDTSSSGLKLGHFLKKRQNFQEELTGVPNTVLGRNRFFAWADSEGMVDRECMHECKIGRQITFETPVTHPFAETFRLEKHCEWMAVHLYDEKSPQLGQTVSEISLLHGFATLPNELRAFPMEWEAADGTDAYEVNFAYHNFLERGKFRCKIVITDARGRLLASNKCAEIHKRIAFRFSHPRCLRRSVGGVKKDFTIPEYKFVPAFNLGLKMLKPQPGFRATAYMLNNEPQPISWPTATYPSRAKAIEAYLESGVNATGSAGEGEDIDSDFAPDAVTEAPPVPFNDTDYADPEDSLPFEDMTKEEREAYEAERARKADQAARIAKAQAAKPGYRTWAIPAGFVTGSVTTFLLCNLVLLCFKRTALIFWYKAMYKRYGSDTNSAGDDKTEGAATGGGTTADGEGSSVISVVSIVGDPKSEPTSGTTSVSLASGVSLVSSTVPA